MKNNSIIPCISHSNFKFENVIKISNGIQRTNDEVENKLTDAVKINLLTI